MSYSRTSEFAIQTTNATPNVTTIPLATGKAIMIEVEYFASSSNDRAYKRQFALVRNISGTLTLIGTTPTNLIALISDAGLSTIGADIGVSGTNVTISLTGIAATTINWVIWIKYHVK